MIKTCCDAISLGGKKMVKRALNSLDEAILSIHSATANGRFSKLH